MKIGVIGAGTVGGTLGKALAKAGHSVVYGLRDPASPKYAGLAHERAELGTVRDAVTKSDAVILATPWNAAKDAVESAGDFGGKPLLDATNPIGAGMALTHGHTDSGAEQVQRWATNAKVVKVFNTTGVENMANPQYGDARVAMWLCGDDDGACALALQLAKDLGFDALRVGKLERARILEPAARLWIDLALVRGQGRNVAFGLLRRGA